ncbi:shikimate dehydrogenase family protein [Methylovirgula sp. 4M-Z18]|uniref:shikimate dehydrogenase family protein n=1 Tax=Methylovirgula sp. 4M-Z18 TaxID=2293567 RepID=UPI000E2FD130|nr:shikimate dehydrogenase [Methylovirgula sp. 4M-Z18]RFB79458.1 shikimate dehydrogenase [Methylovirgula sp. 4M-Z18]
MTQDIDGNTSLIAHIGYPTGSFKAPMIYNPYFEHIKQNAVVVPMGVKPEDFEVSFPAIFRFSNIHGALITMPHKVHVLSFLDEISTTAKVAGACNAVRKDPSGRLVGDMFDGEGFTRGLSRKGVTLAGASALVIGSGGVGSAIAASLAAARVARLGLYDVNAASAQGLGERLHRHYPQLELDVQTNDPAGYDVLVNATPLGMKPGDPMPVDMVRLSPHTFVGEVVMKQEMTPFLAQAVARGCKVQVGIDMLFEQIPAYLEFFGFPTTTAEVLRDLAHIHY